MGLNLKTSEYTNHSVFLVLSACLQKSSYENLLSYWQHSNTRIFTDFDDELMVINTYADKDTKKEIMTVTT